MLLSTTTRTALDWRCGQAKCPPTWNFSHLALNFQLLLCYDNYNCASAYAWVGVCVNKRVCVWKWECVCVSFSWQEVFTCGNCNKCFRQACGCVLVPECVCMPYTHTYTWVCMCVCICMRVRVCVYLGRLVALLRQRQSNWKLKAAAAPTKIVKLNYVCVCASECMRVCVCECMCLFVRGCLK